MLAEPIKTFSSSMIMSSEGERDIVSASIVREGRREEGDRLEWM
jgi:hypothetical protein